MRLLLILCVVVPLLYLGAPWDRSEAIVNADPIDQAPSWVAMILGVGAGGGGCSGTLIAPDLILSARPGHCPDPMGRQVIAAVGRSDLTHQGQGAQATVVRAWAHPSLDLGIYQLDTTLLLPPVTFGSGDLNTRSPSQTPVTLYGYGRTTEITQAPVYDQKLRSALGFVQGNCSRDVPEFCLVPQKNQGPCRGDSGGPLLASGALIGVYLGNLGNQQGVRCVGNSWYAVSVTDPAVKQWIDQIVEAEH